MRNFKAAFVIIICLLCFANVQGYWEPLPPPPQYNAYAGSALCAGIATEEDGRTRRSVWFLQDGYYGNDIFSRYDIDDFLWRSYGIVPFVPLGPDGAIAFVPDPYAFPENGWVLCLRGNETREFWVFYPEDGAWVQGPPVPETVEEGAALCFGGFQEIYGRSYAVLYAFTGKEHEISPGYYRGHFFRYIFEIVPYINKGLGRNSAPIRGSWERLADIVGHVEEEAALAWVPMSPDSPIAYPMGLVIGLKNNEDGQGWIYHYDPVRNTWWDVRPIVGYRRLYDGACMTAHYRDSTMFLEGGGTEYYNFYDVIRGTIYSATSTPQKVREGTALAGLLPKNDTIYAEFGRQLAPPAPGFSRHNSPPYQEGSQGTSTNLNAGINVVLQPHRTFHIFTVKCASGAVRLLIMDITGRTVAYLSAECRNEVVDIIWNHPIIPSGVYFWKVSSTSGVTNGKLVITK
ncbi:T9SS type A sorting domain-containing protein [candidate division WOR-3 bacterium]|jgi:hypothetical protein|nr:T9SS type A sorting domain-containing protein [candidate division WOR-3 bacterium]